MRSKDDQFLWLSTRRIRRRGDAEWTDYAASIDLPQMEEVRTIDSWCNPCVDDCGNYPVNSLDEVWERLELLPKPAPGREYYLLFMDALVHTLPPDPCVQLLGHDLSDETWTSSLLNCGRWQGELQRIAERAGKNGLLSLSDALAAQRILPQAWPGNPHGIVTVWALYEVRPPAG